MISARIQRIIVAVKQDEARLQAIEQMSAEAQAQYAPGIAKLRQRIYDERHALGATPDDTEAWAKWLLDDFPYHEHPEAMRRTINRYLEMVEQARQSCDVRAMASAQRRLEQIVEEAERSTPQRAAIMDISANSGHEKAPRQEQLKF